MTKKETVEPKNVKFEDALKRLEGIVEKLETGDASLDESLSLYEEGISLFRSCSSKLEEAKKKVEVLSKKGASGKLEPVPFAGGEEVETVAVAVVSEDEGEEKEELPF